MVHFCSKTSQKRFVLKWEVWVKSIPLQRVQAMLIGSILVADMGLEWCLCHTWLNALGQCVIWSLSILKPQGRSLLQLQLHTLTQNIENHAFNSGYPYFKCLICHQEWQLSHLREQRTAQTKQCLTLKCCKGFSIEMSFSCEQEDCSSLRVSMEQGTEMKVVGGYERSTYVKILSEVEGSRKGLQYAEMKAKPFWGGQEVWIWQRGW